MDIYRDFRELFELLNAKGVEYIVVGGYALAHHGFPRYTRDIDVYVRPSAENSARLMEVLEAFGFGSLGLTKGDFEKPGNIIQLGYPPVRIDLITAIEGVSWEQAAAGRVAGEYDGQPVPFIGLAELIANKKAAGRDQDLLDIRRLTGAQPPEKKRKPKG